MILQDLRITDFSQGGLLLNDCEGITHIKQLPCFSIVESLEGYYTVSIDNSPVYRTQKNGFFIAPSQKQQTITHHVSAETGWMRARWIFFNVLVNDCYPLDALYRFPVCCDVKSEQELHRLFEEIFSTNDRMRQYACLLTAVSILLPTAEPIQPRDEAMTQVMQYLQQRYRESLSISDLTKLTHLSQSALFSRFKAVFGTSPLHFLCDYRLSKAALLLESTNLHINEIAEQVGFDDSFYFSKLFKRKYHLSPRDYKKQWSGIS